MKNYRASAGELDEEEIPLDGGLFIPSTGARLVVRNNPSGSCKYCYFYDNKKQRTTCGDADFKQGPCSSKTRDDKRDVVFVDRKVLPEIDKELQAFGKTPEEKKRIMTSEGIGMKSFLAAALLAGAPMIDAEGAAKKPVSNKPTVTAPAKVTQEQILKRRTEIVAKTIYTEAAGESYDGKRAIATVILNRSKQKRWSNKTLSEICREKFQFSGWNKGEPTIKINNPIDQKAWDESVKIAKELVYGNFKPVTEIGSANHYYNPKKASPSWGNKMTEVKVFGNHKFGIL